MLSKETCHVIGELVGVEKNKNQRDMSCNRRIGWDGEE